MGFCVESEDKYVRQQKTKFETNFAKCYTVVPFSRCIALILNTKYFITTSLSLPEKCTTFNTIFYKANAEGEVSSERGNAVWLVKHYECFLALASSPPLPYSSAEEEFSKPEFPHTKFTESAPGNAHMTILFGKYLGCM